MKKTIVLVVLILGSFSWAQQQEVYEEKQIQILLEKDVALKDKVQELWSVIRQEEESQKIFFSTVNKKIRELLLYNLKYKMQYQELTTRYESLLKDADYYKNECKNWQNKCDGYVTDINNLKKNVDYHKNTSNDWKNKCDEYTTSIDNLKKNVDYYKNTSNDWKNKCDEYTTSIDNLKKNVDYHKNISNDWKNKCDTYSSELDRYKKQSDSYEDKYKDSYQQCIQAKKDNENLLAIIDKLRGEKVALQKDCDTLRGDYNASLQYKNERDTLWQKNQQMSLEIAALNQKLAEMNKPVTIPKDRGDNWYIAEGRGSTLRGALADAWQKAMLKSLKENYDSSDFEAHKKEIEDFLGKNWREYTVGQVDEPIIVKKYDSRRVTIRVRVAEDDLLRDIKFLFDKARTKLEGMEVAFISELNGNNDVAKNVMFDTIQDKLGQDVVVRDLRAIDNLMKVEAQTLGLLAGADPASYVARKFNQVKILVYIDVETSIQRDPYAGDVAYAKLRCRGVWQQTAQELWHFQMSSGKEAKPVPTAYIGANTARERAAKNLGLLAYEKIREQVRERQNVAPLQTYELKFVNFYNKRDRQKIYDSLADLKQDKNPLLKILPGSYGGGENYVVFKIQWLRNKHSIEDVIDYIEGTCSSNEVSVNANNYSKGVIIFTPSSDY